MPVSNLYRELYESRFPGAAAIRLAEGPVISSAELSAQVGALAAILCDMGIEPGQRVSMRTEERLGAILVAHACFRIGAIIHPLNPTYTDAELSDLIADAQPTLLVCDEAEAPRLQSVLSVAAVRTVEELARRSADGARAGMTAPILDVGSDAVAALLYTSGTTGRPKGAQITHGNLGESAIALKSVWELDDADRLLHVLPLYHAHGLLTAVNSILAAGGSLILGAGASSSDIVAALPAATLFMGVPTHYARLVQEPGLEAAIGAGFRLAICGSAPLPDEVSDAFVRRTGRQIHERYGMTEAAIITAVPAGVTDRSGWVGWPVPGVNVRVALPDGSRAGRLATGILETNGHNVFRGYWNRPEADAEALTDDGWLITGDIAEIDASGCVRLLGRAKDLIITGGLNVFPREVEQVLDQHPGILESAVFGVPHPDFGEAVVAVVEVASMQSINERDILLSARGRLAPYKVPKSILPVSKIPRNPLGKVLKSKLRETYGSLFAGSK